MLFEELNGVQSECRSYLLADSGEALIVDPLLEGVDAYLARLGQLGLKLALAADSHTHADHLSGAKELKRRTNKRMLAGREKFLSLMREPRPTKPARMAEALAYNTSPT